MVASNESLWHSLLSFFFSNRESELGKSQFISIKSSIEDCKVRGFALIQEQKGSLAEY